MAEKIKGLKELQRKLAALGPAVGGKALRQATNAAMLPVLQQARSSAPEGTTTHKTYKGRVVFPGFLRRSVIRRSRLSRDKKTAWARVGVKREAFYGTQFLEIGTSRMPRRPWLTPAMDERQDQVTLLLKKKLKAQIDKARKKK